MSYGCPGMLKWSQILAFLITLNSCKYVTLNSCKYLKSETHLWNAHVNKANSVNRDCQNVPDCGHAKEKLFVNHFCWFGSFWFILSRCNFSTAERFKYLFFTDMKIQITAPIVNNKTIFFLVH